MKWYERLLINEGIYGVIEVAREGWL